MAIFKEGDKVVFVDNAEDRGSKEIAKKFVEVKEGIEAIVQPEKAKA